MKFTPFENFKSSTHIKGSFGAIADLEVSSIYGNFVSSADIRRMKLNSVMNGWFCENGQKLRMLYERQQWAVLAGNHIA